MVPAVFRRIPDSQLPALGQSLSLLNWSAQDGAGTVLRTEQGPWGEHLQQAVGRGTMGNSQVPRCMAVCGNKDRKGLAECRLA